MYCRVVKQMSTEVSEVRAASIISHENLKSHTVRVFFRSCDTQTSLTFTLTLTMHVLLYDYS
jgi:hypothetical protein